MSKLNVLVTGVSGRIGPHVVGPFRECYTLRMFDRRGDASQPDLIIVELLDFDALKRAMQGIDVVLHLAATSDERPFIEELVPNNIVGLYNVFQAAHETGVRRIVFASTCQTVLKYPHDRTVEITDPVRPCSIYGATKVFGEVLGRFYHDQHGMEFVGIRIGAFGVGTPEHLRRSAMFRHLWLSPRDAVKLFRCAIEKPGVGYAVVFGTSRTEREYLSLTAARELLGFEPDDDVMKQASAEIVG